MNAILASEFSSYILAAYGITFVLVGGLCALSWRSYIKSRS
jgi:hypothetical protein